MGWLLENDYWEAGLNQAVEDARFPVIAACNGHTLGGGAVLALACDIRVASASAKFGFPEVKVAAFCSGSGTQRLPRLVGRGRALDLLLTGRIIDAAEALSYGLVEYVFPDGEMIEKTLDMAEGIAAFPGAVTAATKRCVNVGLREGYPRRSGAGAGAARPDRPRRRRLRRASGLPGEAPGAIQRRPTSGGIGATFLSCRGLRETCVVALFGGGVIGPGRFPGAPNPAEERIDPRAADRPVPTGRAESGRR